MKYFSTEKIIDNLKSPDLTKNVLFSFGRINRDIKITITYFLVAKMGGNPALMLSKMNQKISISDAEYQKLGN